MPCRILKTVVCSEIPSLLTCWKYPRFIQRDFTLVSVSEESDAHFLSYTPAPQCHSEHAKKNYNPLRFPALQWHKFQGTHTSANTHTLAVLSLLLLLTAHQSPVSACRNMLTPAISLKSLSIRASCAGPSTLCKPKVRNPPTRRSTHARSYMQAKTHVHTNEGAYRKLTAYAPRINPIA